MPSIRSWVNDMTLNLNRIEENNLEDILNSDVPNGEKQGAELDKGKGGFHLTPLTLIS